MKILLGEKEYEINLSSVAVETIEEKYDKAIDEIMKTGMRAKDYNFILWASIADAPELDTFKKLLAEKYNYIQVIKLFNRLTDTDPNAEGAEGTKSE